MGLRSLRLLCVLCGYFAFFAVARYKGKRFQRCDAILTAKIAERNAKNAKEKSTHILHLRQLLIIPIQRNQITMRSSLHDSPLLHHDDLIRMPDR